MRPQKITALQRALALAGATAQRASESGVKPQDVETLGQALQSLSQIPLYGLPQRTAYQIDRFRLALKECGIFQNPPRKPDGMALKQKTEEIVRMLEYL